MNLFTEEYYRSFYFRNAAFKHAHPVGVGAVVGLSVCSHGFRDQGFKEIERPASTRNQSGESSGAAGPGRKRQGGADGQCRRKSFMQGRGKGAGCLLGRIKCKKGETRRQAELLFSILLVFNSLRSGGTPSVSPSNLPLISSPEPTTSNSSSLLLPSPFHISLTFPCRRSATPHFS